MVSLRRLIGQPESVETLDLTLAKRVAPHEGTNQSLWNSQIPAFWQETYGSAVFSPRLAERVWVANRCLQLNAQQISSMPLRFEGTWQTPPRWLSSPDPHWYPNGIRDALFAAVRDYYHGDVFIQVTGRYESGFPQTWTLLPREQIEVKLEDGSRVYEQNGARLNAANIIHIVRDPSSGAVRGTSALASYARSAWNVLASGDATGDIMNNNPPAVLKALRKVDEEQARAISDQWSSASSNRRRGVPPVIGPDLELAATNLGFAPKDLMLLEAQEFDARVIATAYGVPASLLNMAVSGGLTYQNPATLGEQWWRFELLTGPAASLASAFTAQMLPAGNRVLFDASATFSPLDEADEGADVAPPPIVAASPSDANRPAGQLTAIGGGG